MYKVIVIGSVGSSRLTLLKLVEKGFNVIGVFGLELDDVSSVSGYFSMENICIEHDINYYPFKKIIDQEDVIKELSPDIIFAVGISQLISKEILNIPSKGTVGFHPTLLPEGRGRAPLAWLVLKSRHGAASFFEISDGIDDGPIFVQEKFEINSKDDASSIEIKMNKAIETSLDRWLPSLKSGQWEPIEQDNKQASEFGKRNPIDGIIDWSESALSIDRLVKATTKPHPGAYSFVGENKLLIWKCSIEDKEPIEGVVGRILKIREADKALLVQTGEGLLWIEDYSFDNSNKEDIKKMNFRIGQKIGYSIQHEIYKLKNEVEFLKMRINELTGN